MGATRVTVKISNPAEPERSWEGEFLVDTGAHDTIVPRKHLEAIGIKPRGTKQYELANGTKVAFDIASAEIEFMGEFTGARVLFGTDDTEPLLGVIAMQAVGAEVDLRNECLRLGATKHLTYRRPVPAG